MFTGAFTTRSLPRTEQSEAWRAWYEPVFETTPGVSDCGGFDASNSNWTVGGFTVSHVSSPAASVTRTKSLIRRSPIDHWALTLSKDSVSKVKVRDVHLEVPSGVPFVLSLGEEMGIDRVQQDRRVQLLLSRDSFGGISRLLDAAAGTVLQTPQGKLLADYVLLLEKDFPVWRPRMRLA